MKAAVIIILWLILGFFYWSQGSKCCQHNEDVSLTDSVVAEVDETTTKQIESDSMLDQSITEQASAVNTEEELTTLEEDEVPAIDDEELSTTGVQETTTFQDYKLDVLLFEPGSFKNITNDKDLVLTSIVDELKSNLDKVVLTGFTDRDGTDSGNLLIAEQRVDYIKSQLIRMGISPHRILTYKKRDNQTQEGMISGRVEIKYIK